MRLVYRKGHMAGKTKTCYDSVMRTLDRKPSKVNTAASDPLITKRKFTELQNELTKLQHIRQQATAEVARLAELGDFSENVEYQLAKGRLRGINNAILKIENQLNQAVIITPTKQTDTIQIGHTVTVETAGGEKTYQILGSSETNPGRGIISHNSPIGDALIGKRVGDSVKIRLADRDVEYEIVRIE